MKITAIHLATVISTSWGLTVSFEPEILNYAVREKGGQKNKTCIWEGKSVFEHKIGLIRSNVWMQLECWNKNPWIISDSYSRYSHSISFHLWQKWLTKTQLLNQLNLEFLQSVAKYWTGARPWYQAWCVAERKLGYERANCRVPNIDSRIVNESLLHIFPFCY